MVFTLVGVWPGQSIDLRVAMWFVECSEVGAVVKEL
jgi:hypothetical protein